MTEPQDVPRRRAFACDATVLGRPVRVLFGAGTLAQVAPETSALGSRVLLVAGRHEDDAADRVSADLGGDVVGRLRDVVQHVPVDLADAAVHRARDLAAEVVVAIGGGSATGLAKAVALETGLPVLAVPTTYAGSEMTPVWGLTGEEGKTTGRDLRVLPRTVVYDPELTVALPADTTAASGMNALAHALEALYAPDVTPRLADLAQEALRALATGLPGAVADGGGLDARTEALYGAWLAGWVLGSTTMGLHHKLAHVLGGTHRLPHAGVHSALLPQVAAFNVPAAPQAFAGAAHALGVEGPSAVARALFDLAERLGAPTSLAALGLRADAVDDVAAAVATAGVPNPRAFDAADLRRVLQDAREGRRPPTDAAPPDRTPRRSMMTDTTPDLATLEAERGRIRAQHLRPAGERPSSSARGLHHTALVSSDVERTIRFYQDVLEFPLTELIENRDYPGSSHFFFDIGNGNLLAFFDFPGLDVGPYAEVLGGLHHMAISVDPERWPHLVRKLDEAGVEHVIHSEVSVYFSDPDGARIELIADPLGEMYGSKVL